MTMEIRKPTLARMDNIETEEEDSKTTGISAHTSPLRPTTTEGEFGHHGMSAPLQIIKNTHNIHSPQKNITSLQHIHFSSGHFSPSLNQPMYLPLRKQMRTVFRSEIHHPSFTISLFTKHELCYSGSFMSPLLYAALLDKIGVGKSTPTIDFGKLPFRHIQLGDPLMDMHETKK